LRVAFALRLVAFPVVAFARVHRLRFTLVAAFFCPRVFAVCACAGALPLLRALFVAFTVTYTHLILRLRCSPAGCTVTPRLCVTHVPLVVCSLRCSPFSVGFCTYIPICFAHFPLVIVCCHRWFVYVQLRCSPHGWVTVHYGLLLHALFSRCIPAVGTLLRLRIAVYTTFCCVCYCTHAFTRRHAAPSRLRSVTFAGCTLRFATFLIDATFGLHLRLRTGLQHHVPHAPHAFARCVAAVTRRTPRRTQFTLIVRLPVTYFARHTRTLLLTRSRFRTNLHIFCYRIFTRRHRIYLFHTPTPVAVSLLITRLRFTGAHFRVRFAVPTWFAHALFAPAVSAVLPGSPRLPLTRLLLRFCVLVTLLRALSWISCCRTFLDTGCYLRVRGCYTRFWILPH